MDKQIDLQRKQAIKYLLPDSCSVYPEHGNNTSVSGVGVMASADPEPRLWRGISTVPCRVDLSRAFRPARLEAQNTEVDEFNLEVPHDFFPVPTDRVHVTTAEGEVHIYVIRKIKAHSEWDVTHEYTITELGVTYDNV